MESKPYHNLWDLKKEIGFIKGIGMEKELDAHGKLIGRKQIKPNKYIIECLQGYIRGSHLKDWDRCGIDNGPVCIQAARERIQALTTLTKTSG
jgi:hypothetical protein